MEEIYIVKYAITDYMKVVSLQQRTKKPHKPGVLLHCVLMNESYF